MAAVFVDFPKNKCNVLHKNKLDTRTKGTVTDCRLQITSDTDDIYNYSEFPVKQRKIVVESTSSPGGDL